jgi:hypothetical protein
MYQLLIRLMLISALFELGIAVSDFKNCHSRQCLRHVEKASRAILKVDWKPVSVFQNEAKRFQ